MNTVSRCLFGLAICLLGVPPANADTIVVNFGRFPSAEAAAGAALASAVGISADSCVAGTTTPPEGASHPCVGSSIGSRTGAWRR